MNVAVSDDGSMIAFGVTACAKGVVRNWLDHAPNWSEPPIHATLGDARDMPFKAGFRGVGRADRGQRSRAAER